MTARLPDRALPAAVARADAPAAARAAACAAIGRAAVVSLYDELALAPKPGLVSFADSGSHRDMDAGTFLRSLFALRRYFPQMARLGAQDADFGSLERAGIAAEARMLRATGGINTHRGAVFTLGLLCAAAGALAARGDAPAPSAVRDALRARWGAALQDRCGRDTGRQGHRIAARFGLRSAGQEAALGFPALFEVGVPALQAARAHGLDARRARLQALFALMAALDDTNLAHRGGLDGLRFAQRAARDWLASGGAAHPQGVARAQALHAAFVTRRLSPGGAADLLAASCWVVRVADAGTGVRAVGERPVLSCRTASPEPAGEPVR